MFYTFEMANNHMGDLRHGYRIIREFAKVKEGFPEFDFAIKFQFRNRILRLHQLKFPFTRFSNLQDFQISKMQFQFTSV